MGRSVKVQVKEVSKWFGELKVLSGISFEVFEGEFICFVGPSGCGKTTLLKVVSGLEKPSLGIVLIDGEPSTQISCNIGFVFQEDSLIPWRNVWSNVKFGLELRRPGAPCDDIISNMVKLVGLSGFENYYPHQLSGGMRKRVAIARALAVDPSILLMDEPFGDLDAQTRWILHRELSLIHGKLGKTTLFVTHNVEEAVYLADRVLVLTKRPATIKREILIDLPKPRNKLSPEFIKYREGIINLLREEIPCL